MSWRNEKWNRSISIWLIIVIAIGVIAALPFFLNRVVDTNPIASGMSEDAWLSFWGSYIGGIITLISIIGALWINDRNIKENRKQIRNNRKLIVYKNFKAYLEKCIYILSPPIVEESDDGFYLCYDNIFKSFYERFEKIEIELKTIEIQTEDIIPKKYFDKTLELFRDIKEKIRACVKDSRSLTLVELSKFTISLMHQQIDPITEIYNEFIQEIKSVE